MMTPDMLVPVAVFASLESGSIEMLRNESGSILGIEPGDQVQHLQESLTAVSRIFRPARDRNRHSIT